MSFRVKREAIIAWVTRLHYYYRRIKTHFIYKHAPISEERGSRPDEVNRGDEENSI